MIFANRIAVLALLAGVLAGCATGPKYEEVRGGIPSLAADKGRIYFYRSGDPIGSGIQPSVMLNGEKVGDSAPGGFFFIDRAPGNCEVKLTTEVDKKLTFTLDAGQEQYVRMSVGLGVLVYRVYPELVDKTTADGELKGLSFTGQLGQVATIPRRRDMTVAAPGLAPSGGGTLRRDATLDRVLERASYTPATALSKRMAEINVLKYAFIDRQTREVVFVGTYDPAYATGPIPYNTLLADALENPYPRFTLDYPGSSRSPVGQMRRILDQEFDRMARDTGYGVQWLERLILPVLKGEGPDPDQQAALNARLNAAGISPAHYRAFLKWQSSGFTDMQAYVDGAGLFLPSLFQAAGASRKTGAELAAYRAFASQPNRDTLELWCDAAGLSDLLSRIDRDVAAGRSRKDARSELVSALYSSILRGLGVPEPELRQMSQAYRSGRVGEEVFVRPIDQKYPEIFKRVLMNKIVNGMVFTGPTLARQYNFAPIQTPVNTYGARRDSPVMNVFFKADYTLKFMTSSPRPGESVSQHQTSQEFLNFAENRAGASAGRMPNTGVIRYWLYPQAVELDTLEGNAGVRFRTASVKVGVELLEAQGADRRGEDFHKATLAQYSAHLTARYDEYARVYPALHALRETEKVIALVRWAQKSGVHVRAAADDTPRVALPDTAEGFWGMTYIVRPSGSMDTMVVWAQGGVDFGRSAGDGWMQANPPDRQVTDDTLRQLAASTALAEKASAAALSGNMESARDLAQRSADAMTGQIDMSRLPEPVMAPVLAPNESVAGRAEVAQAAIAATEANTAALAKARTDLQQAEPLKTSDPARYAQIQQQSGAAVMQSEQNLRHLQDMLQKYRLKPADSSAMVVDLRKLNPDKPMVVGQLSTGTAGRAPGCPITPKKRLPTREELVRELAGLRSKLDVLKFSLMRLNRSIQMDQQQFAEWEKETQDAVDRAHERLKKAIWDNIERSLFDYGTEYYKKVEPSPEKVDAIEKIGLLLKEGDVYDWAAKGEKTWDQIAEGLKLLGDNLPLSREAQDVLWASQNTLDSAFDTSTTLVSWLRISQLEKNSDAFLAAVRQSGEHMNQIVRRIKDIEDQLASRKVAPESRPQQAGATTVCE